MSGKRRVFKSTAGSIFFASAYPAALSSQADRLVRNCTKIGTDALYMEIVMERSLRVGCRRADKLPGSSAQRHRTAEKTRILNDARRSRAKVAFRAAGRRAGNSGKAQRTLQPTRSGAK